MNFIKNISQGFNILKLKKEAIKKISENKGATNTGILIVMIAGLLSVVGLYKTPDYYKVLITAPIFTLVFFILSTGVLQVFVRLFGGKIKYAELFRVLSHAAIMCWLWLFLVIPTFGDILNLAIIAWGAVVAIATVEKVNELSRTRAILAVLIPLIVGLGVVALVAVLVLKTQLA